MKIGRVCAWFLMLGLFAPLVHAKDAVATSPQAVARTYAQNYKDMVLAECVATAYKQQAQATTDAGSSAAALKDWTNYDWEQNPYNDVVPPLVEKYLARNYHNPLAEADMKGVRFDFLKCLDLYHSKELDVLVKRVVIKPKHSYLQDQLPVRRK